MSGFSNNRARARVIRMKWSSLAIPVGALIFLLIDMIQGWRLDRPIRLVLIAAVVVGLIFHFSVRLILAKWFSGSFTDDQDPMRF